MDNKGSFWRRYKSIAHPIKFFEVKKNQEESSEGKDNFWKRWLLVVEVQSSQLKT